MVSLEVYFKMKSIVSACIAFGKPLPNIDDSSFGQDSLQSLYNQMVVRDLKKGSHNVEMIIYTVRDRVQRGESLLNIAATLGFSPYKLAKIYLQTILGYSIFNIIDNPSIILDIRLRKDILACISEDPICSHESAQLQECCGREYEELLIRRLRQLQMCFETESDLRSRGKPKTPDILLLIPMAIKTKSSSNMVVVNWIDSKAIFCDPETAAEHLEQFKAYTNRYGRGLVIYWQGFVETIIEQVSGFDFVVTDDFPEFWMYPSGDIASEFYLPVFDTLDA